MRIECPTCQTSYTTERLGVDFRQDQMVKATVVCMCCKTPFDAVITPKTVTETPGWAARTFLRRKPVSKLDGHTVATAARE